MLRRIARSLPPVPALKQRIEHLEQENRALRSEIDLLKSNRQSLLNYSDGLESDLVQTRNYLGQSAAELRDTCIQRDALCSERDDLKQHLMRLEVENDGFRAQVTALYAELDDLRAHAERLKNETERAEHRFDVVSRERDDLREHAARLDKKLQRVEEFTRAAPPGHFYSPLIDTADPQVRIALGNPPPLSDIPSFRPVALREHHRRLMRHASSVQLVVNPAEGHRYYLENDFFSYADALAYACLLIEYRPRRVVEIGCGFSSCLAMDINDSNLGGNTELSFYDPHARWSRLAEDDPYRTRIHDIPLQQVPIETFDQLETGDVLFYDGSHVVKTGSDVNHFFFHVLPRIRPGVLVHIHDVFYPFEYPRHWVLDDRRNWSEIYLLRAYLQQNRDVETLVFNDYLYQHHPELAEEPLALRNTGSSFWFRKLEEDSPCQP